MAGSKFWGRICRSGDKVHAKAMVVYEDNSPVVVVP